MREVDKWCLSIAPAVSDWRFSEAELCHEALSLPPAVRLEEGQCMGGGAEGGVLCNAGDWGWEGRSGDGDGGQTQGCLTRNTQAQVV